MPSPRSRFETVCRVGAFAALGWLIGQSVIPLTVRRVESVRGAEIASHLGMWTRAANPPRIHLTLDAAPVPWVADWLGAFAHSGRAVSWTGKPAALAAALEPAIDPTGGVRVEVAAPAGSHVAVGDAAGAIDSIGIKEYGATIAAPLAVDPITVRVAGEEVTARLPDSAVLKAIVVVGAAGWEAKYVATALEERGWSVVARFSVAPSVDVTEGAIVLDTSKVAAVVAVDSTVDMLGASLERFVRSGGGLVLVGTASAAKAAVNLAPGSLGARTHPTFATNDTIRLGTTGFYPVALRGDAVALERRAGGVAVAARRVGAGRVLQLGYDDDWRWRLAGGSGSLAAHREWWTRVVGSVAYVPPRASGSRTAFGAPLADFVDRVGPARPAPATPRTPMDRRIWLTVILILLLTEWASRRLRGYR